MKMKMKKMKKGVLLVNLGSPDSPSRKDVKKYLGEFLMDKKVINIPKIFRSILVKGIILNTRPKKSAKAYSKIWWEEGSPLIVLSNRLKEKVEKKTNFPIELSMRYGNPSIEIGIKNLVKKGVKEILIFPLYPQFAMATTETIIDLSKKIVLEKGDELGMFKTGSTVILLFDKRIDFLQSIKKGKNIRVGNRIGKISSKIL